MKCIHKIMAMAALAVPAAAAAQTPQLVVHNANAEVQVWKMTDISCVIFGDHSVIISANDGDTEVPHADFARLTFDHEGIFQPTALPAAPIAKALAGRLTARVEGDRLCVSGLTDGRQSVSVYTPAGVLALRATVANGASVDISSLASGLYILVSENQSAKFIK